MAKYVASAWRSAYKTLSYYVGRHEKDVSDELLLNLCGECLRLGFKAEANMQELSQWLRKGVAACLIADSAAAIEEALDFIDAYSELFSLETDGSGKRLLGNVLENLRLQAESHNMSPQLAVLVKDMGLA